MVSAGYGHAMGRGIAGIGRWKMDGVRVFSTNEVDVSGFRVRRVMSGC